MHVSSFKFGNESTCERHEYPAPSEVRVRYFDPRTGEPCDTKPEPLNGKRESMSLLEREAKRIEAEEEAAAIMRNMKERNKAIRKEKAKANGRKKPVLVDGKRFESLLAAAKEVGTTQAYISTILKNGGGIVKGRQVYLAKEEK